MIIERQYEWFGLLYENDKMSRDVIDEAFRNSKSEDDWKKEVLEFNYSHISAYFNIGCGLPGDSYPFIMARFKELDEKYPYDNGLTFKDIDRIEFETSRKGRVIQMRFVSERANSPYRIVGFAAVENKEGVIDISEGWEMTAPYVIG